MGKSLCIKRVEEKTSALKKSVVGKPGGLGIYPTETYTIVG